MAALGKYLNEHLSGSYAALNLLEALAREHPSSAATYKGLHAGILQNRTTLQRLVSQAGIGRARGMEIAARIASHLALLRFRGHGMKKGSLGLVEALEALELGVHGQTLLWRGLVPHQGRLPEWKNTDFAALLLSAEAQKATVEGLRIQAVAAAFFQAEVNL